MRQHTDTPCGGFAAPPLPPQHTTMVKTSEVQRFQISTLHTWTIYEHAYTAAGAAAAAAQRQQLITTSLGVLLSHLYVDESVGQVERGGPGLPWHFEVVGGGHGPGYAAAPPSDCLVL